MHKIFITSDLHFYHKNILKYENRPWKTVDEMNQALITNWNVIVDKDDIVYILGDFAFASWTKIKGILKQLNGDKILVRGNHDHNWSDKDEALKYFCKIVDYEELTYRGYNFVMFHHPIACWNGMERGSIHLYGHIHSSSHNLPEGFNRKQSYNVSVDTNHYKPVSLDWIIDIKEKAKHPEKYIPKNTLYCYNDDMSRCPFWDYAENRGEQNYGVCHYLNTTDYEQNKIMNNSDDGCWIEPGEDGYHIIPGTTAEIFGDEQFTHSLLWDECKECGINDNIDL